MSNFRSSFSYKGFRVTYQNFSPWGHRGVWTWITENGCSASEATHGNTWHEYHGTSEEALAWIDTQVEDFGED